MKLEQAIQTRRYYSEANNSGFAQPTQFVELEKAWSYVIKNKLHRGIKDDFDADNQVLKLWKEAGSPDYKEIYGW